MQNKVKISDEQKEINNYADEIIKKILSYKKSKKFQYTFLKNLNDLLAPAMDPKDIASLEKEIAEQYNKKLAQNHKKTKVKDEKVVVKKLNMRTDQDDEYADNDYDDDYENDYNGFKK